MAARANGLRRFTAKRRRRRTANTTKVRYQAPTARNQRKQILANARAIKYIQKVLPQKVYCDWHYFGNMFAAQDPVGNLTRTWFCIPLTNLPAWDAVMRADQNVVVASTTFIQRLQINLRLALQQANYAFYNIWVVTPRKNQNARDSPVDFANGQFPIVNIDYIEGPTGANLRLNSAIWKVHYAKYATLTETTLGEAALAPPLTAGNPFTTWQKAQINMPVKMKVRKPQSGTPWTAVTYMNLPYYQRYQLLVQILQQSPGTATPNVGARLDWDMLATTINAD